jgi:hypothetical protein
MIVYALRVWKSGEEKGETAEEDGEEAPLTEQEEHIGDLDYEAEEAEIEDDDGIDEGQETTLQDNDTKTTLTAEEHLQRQDDKFFDARRLFPWQKGQRALAAKVWAIIKSGSSPKKQMLAVRNFSKSFIFQNMLHDRFKSLLIHFLALLGIEEDLGRLHKANDYSYMLAGMTYCVRAIGVEILLPARKRKQQHDAATRNFLQNRKVYLCDGEYGVMTEALSLLAYGKTISRMHTNEGMAFWADKDKKTVMEYCRKKIAVPDICKMVEEVTTESEDLLWKELMWVDGQNQNATTSNTDNHNNNLNNNNNHSNKNHNNNHRCEIDLKSIGDNITFRERNYNFSSNKENEKLFKGTGVGWMLDRMTSTRSVPLISGVE